MLKYAFNLVDDGLVGQQLFAGEATRLAYGTDEAAEGRDAFLEKRPPDWSGPPVPLLTWMRPERPQCCCCRVHDQRGIVAAVANFVVEHDGNIVHADQHVDCHRRRGRCSSNAWSSSSTASARP